MITSVVGHRSPAWAPSIFGASPFGRWVVTHFLADFDFHDHRPAVKMNQQSLWYLMRVQLKHLSPTLGSSFIASSAYRTRRLVRTKKSSGFYLQVTDFFTHHFFYTDDFTHKPFLLDPSTQTLERHTKSFGIQTLVHTRAFTRKRFPQRRLCTQLLEPSAGNRLHMDAFTQSLSTHRRFCTRTLLRAKALTLNSFTQFPLHTNAFTHDAVTHGLHTKLVHTKSFKHNSFIHTQILVAHTKATQTLKHLHRNVFTHKPMKPLFCLRFRRSTLISCERVPWEEVNLHFNSPPKFFHSPDNRTWFRVAGCSRTKEKMKFYSTFVPSTLILCNVAILLHFLDDRNHFIWKGCSVTSKLLFFLQFRLPTLISCERVASREVKLWLNLCFGLSNFISCEILADRPTFRAKG